jgi:integrase/recombinase XerD
VTALAYDYREARRIVHEAEAELMRDRSYRQFPIGQEWGRFLRAKRLAGKRPNTIDSYEGVGRRFTLRFAHLDSLEPFASVDGPELILDFFDELYGESDPATQIQRFRVLSSFFRWAYKNERISRDPMQRIETPRKKKRQRGAARPRVPQEHVSRLVSAQPSLRDQVALLLMARLALRREDVRLLQLGDIDLARDEIRLRHVKGGGEHVLPIGFRDLRLALNLHLQERDGHPSEYLLYPRSQKLSPFTPAGIDYWFRRCLVPAGLVGYTMHQLRHAAIDELNRRTHGNVEAARQLARHEHVEITQDYLHSTTDDLRSVLEEMGDV